MKTENEVLFAFLGLDGETVGLHCGSRERNRRDPSKPGRWRYASVHLNHDQVEELITKLRGLLK